jgi:hypothetical protein
VKRCVRPMCKQWPYLAHCSGQLMKARTHCLARLLTFSKAAVVVCHYGLPFWAALIVFFAPSIPRLPASNLVC